MLESHDEEQIVNETVNTGRNALHIPSFPEESESNLISNTLSAENCEPNNTRETEAIPDKNCPSSEEVSKMESGRIAALVKESAVIDEWFINVFTKSEAILPNSNAISLSLSEELSDRPDDKNKKGSPEEDKRQQCSEEFIKSTDLNSNEIGSQKCQILHQSDMQVPKLIATEIQQVQQNPEEELNAVKIEGGKDCGGVIKPNVKESKDLGDEKRVATKSQTTQTTETTTTTTVESIDSVPQSQVERFYIWKSDYSDGIPGKFDNVFPAELTGFIAQATYTRTIDTINLILAKSEQIKCATVRETLLELVTCSLIYSCRKSRKEKFHAQLLDYIQEENERYYLSRRVKIKNPFLNGLRYIEIVFLDNEFIRQVQSNQNNVQC